MKKQLLLLVITLFVSTGAMAQTEHLKFMGIPLNGIITQFQNKIMAKGLQVNSAANKFIPAGCRAFTGVFSGKNADIYVYYDEKNKLVYRAKAVITFYQDSYRQSAFEKFKESLDNKYSGMASTDEQDGYPSYILIVENSKEERIGDISMYMTDRENSYPAEYTLHIDYNDELNSEKHEKNNDDDL